MKINICHLYPDVLNLYGDKGNILCLQKRLAWRGIDVQVTRALMGEKVDFADFDLFFMGGGQDFEHKALLEDVKKGRDREIKAVIQDGKVFLAVCAGYQMLGNSYTTGQGERLDTIGALDAQTIGQKERMVGNCSFAWKDEVVVGFENHSGKTYLGQGASPLGKVLCGFGNNGEDGGEGARAHNLFATYAHGPILPKNPGFCDHLLQLAVGQKYPDIQLQPLEDELENRAHAYMENRLQKQRAAVGKQKGI